MSDDTTTKVKREQADSLFRAHVQSVAFHLTLSRQMIDALQIVRDTDQWVNSGALSGFARWVPAARAIERRGLIFHDWRKGWPKDHRIYQLTTAGELVCELCVEAGLMPARQRKRKAA